MKKKFLLEIFILKIRLLLIFTLFISVINCEGTTRERCHSIEGSRGCAQCIKQHADCAWCADPRLNSSQRCDLKSSFSGSVCAPNYIYSPSTELKIAPQHNLPLGGRRMDSPTPIQLEPQQVEVRMKPGDLVEIPFKYLHIIPKSGYEVRDFSIQTSELRALGLDIEFSVECDGQRISGRVCPGIKPDQKINFYAKISLLNNCINTNLIAVSVGIYGYNTVSAIFVTPLCGCDCENPRYQEKRSPRCGYQGNLVCGVCQCDQGKGGEKCECDLNRYGVSSPDYLLEQCREHRTASVCSGKGKCSCGKCSCNADFIRGKFCECDSTDCPLNVEGKLCSAHGQCECGKCVCENGFSGEDCSCSEDPAPCTENTVTCSDHGYCECGKCSCNVGWTGARCNVEQALPVEEEEKSSEGADETEITTEASNEEITASSSEHGKNKVPKTDHGDLLPANSNDHDKSAEEQLGEEVSLDSSPSLNFSIWLHIGRSTVLAIILSLMVL